MPSSTPRTVAFLLGSGVSIPAGMPSTKKITERILSGEGVMRHTDGNYYLGKPLYAHVGIPDEYIPRVVTFLKRLKVEIDLYYLNEMGRSTNYEDLYYASSQVCDSESGEYDNPVLKPFIDKIVPDIQPLLVCTENEIKRVWQTHKLAEEATNYVRDVVWHLLSEPPGRLDHLGLLVDACRDTTLSNLDIFTLNHDTVLEKCLWQSDVQFIDGFGESVNHVRYWNPELLDRESSKIRLFKLHGSVDWLRLRPIGEDWRSDSIGIPLNADRWHTKSPKGQEQRPVDGRPVLLVGTFNKMLQYAAGIFADLHYNFRRSLRRIQDLIVCGYGFGDKGINTHIAEWTATSAHRKITIVHPDPGELRTGARGAIRNKWDEWINQDRLRIIAKTVQHTSWQEITDGDS